MPTRRTVLASAALAPLAAVTTAGAQEPTEGTSTEALGVPFGEVDGTQLVMDIFQPSARDDPRPAVLLLHDFRSMGSRSTMYRSARALAGGDYVAFVVGFRVLWPQHIDDAQLAVRWVRANASVYGVDPERIGAYGLGLGGQAAAMLGVRDAASTTAMAHPEQSSRVACVVAVGSDLDLTIPYPNPEDQEGVTGVLGGTVDEAPDAYREHSPISYVDAQSSPFLLIHGGNDLAIPIEHSQRMANALQAAEVEVVYVYFPDATQVTAANWPLNGTLTLAFFGRHLHPER